MPTLTPRAIASAVGIAIWASTSMLACTYDFDGYVTNRDPGGGGAVDAQTQQDGAAGGRTAIDGPEGVDAVAQATGGQGIVDAPTAATGGQGGAVATGGREGIDARADAPGGEGKVDAFAVGGQGGADAAFPATGGDAATTGSGGKGGADAATTASGGQDRGDAATTGSGGKGGADAGTAAAGQGGSDAATTATGGKGGADAGTATGGQGSSDAASGGQGGADAGTTASSDAASCSGPLRGGICWYLGPDGSSCQQVCTSHGTVATGAASHVGTTAQGGSLAECGILLGLLGVTGTPANGTRSDGLGLGCHVYNSALWWLSAPAFDATASHASSRLACGCTR